MGATGMWLRKIDTASTGDPLVLVVVEGSDRRTLVLDHFPFTIGRRTDRDLVMADPRVSREHAQFIREADGTYIIDQGSRHGTFVNGEAMTGSSSECRERPTRCSARTVLLPALHSSF
jgi:pSer/pThr/pTyr-binding forkhead associated (FHA) protein